MPGYWMHETSGVLRPAVETEHPAEEALNRPEREFPRAKAFGEEP